MAFMFHLEVQEKSERYVVGINQNRSNAIIEQPLLYEAIASDCIHVKVVSKQIPSKQVYTNNDLP